MGGEEREGIPITRCRIRVGGVIGCMGDRNESSGLHSMGSANGGTYLCIFKNS